METYLIHCLKINANRPVNECPYSVGLKENARQYYVYLLFPNASAGTAHDCNAHKACASAEEKAAERAAEKQPQTNDKAAERAAEKQRKADEKAVLTTPERC